MSLMIKLGIDSRRSLATALRAGMYDHAVAELRGRHLAEAAKLLGVSPEAVQARCGSRALCVVPCVRCWLCWAVGVVSCG